MILYSDDTSPWCAPVRAAIYAKGLDIPMEGPPGGFKSEAHKAATVTGTIPCLMLDDGSPLPESAVIIAYLDDKFPERPLTSIVGGRGHEFAASGLVHRHRRR